MNNPMIFGRIWPNVNLARGYNQAAHVVEHLLINQKARSLLRQNAVLINGYTSELYMGIYAVSIKTSVDFSNLQLDTASIDEAVLTTKQELLERQDDRSIMEQFSRAVFTPDSPTNRQPYFELSKAIYDPAVLADLSAYHDIQLSFENFDLPEIRTEHNRLVDQSLIKITHQDQSNGLADVSIYYPLDFKSENYALYDALAFSLADWEYGQIYASLRSAGLIYSLEAYPELYSQSICLRFSVAEDNLNKALDLISSGLKAYKITDETLRAYNDDLYLKWQDPRAWALRFLEEAVIGQVIIPPKRRHLSADGIMGIVEELNNNRSLTVIRTHKKNE